MTRTRLLVMIVPPLLIIAAAFARYVGPGTFDLSWHTFDGGGAMNSVGGAFELAGTIGQPDAQVSPVMTGGGPPGVGFEVVGGFWPGITPTVDTCQPDLNGDSLVNIDDLLDVISRWGACPAPPAQCPADIAPPGGNGAVDVDDLLAVIGAWGDCP